jgi:two-component system LytT family response regulator
MPKMDGFELLRELQPESLPIVIFTTAYEQHALRAFDAHALDYLVKPFKPARFKRAIQRVRILLENQQAGDVAQRLLGMLSERQTEAADELTVPGGKFLTRLTVKVDDKVTILKTRDIEYIESAGNYVVAKGRKSNHILRETLSGLERQLNPDQFIRISRSAIVNSDCIKGFAPGLKGGHTVILQSGETLAMTRGMREVEKTLKYS